MNTHITVSFKSVVRMLSLAASGFLMIGCSLGDLVKTEYPLGAKDPATAKTASGAVEQYRGTIDRFRIVTGSNLRPLNYITASGLLSDEMNAGQYHGTVVTLNAQSYIDSRHIPDNSPHKSIEDIWRGLHQVRNNARNSISSLKQYAPESPPDMIGHAYALWGMSEMFLANLYCSGIPLTTVNTEGGYKSTLGFATRAVYDSAIAKFDSALAVTNDSMTYRYLAQVGKGWAFLQLGEYEKAKDAVAGVPDDFVYNNLYSAGSTPGFVPASASWLSGANVSSNIISTGWGTVSDSEGVNGLPYISSGDPRSRTLISTRTDASFPSTVVRYPARWALPVLGSAPITMASGVEARLIEAEALFHAGQSTWVDILNRLRNDGTFTINPDGDTVWGAGTGAVLFANDTAFHGLKPLQDPGTDEARIDLIFQERAYWLFLTGRRHSDMRRLVRIYFRPTEEVFPIGVYPIGETGIYGNDVNLPAPEGEMLLNNRYQGCLDRNA